MGKKQQLIALTSIYSSRIVVPHKVREELELKEGDKLAVFLDNNEKRFTCVKAKEVNL